MINMLCSHPVRPHDVFLCPLGEASDTSGEHEDVPAQEEIADLAQAETQLAVDGAEHPESHGHLVKPLPTPPSMTPAERA